MPKIGFFNLFTDAILYANNASTSNLTVNNGNATSFEKKSSYMGGNLYMV